ncbi:MAG: triose-phosphate isomerase [Candidatus Saccharimonadales bacterium]
MRKKIIVGNWKMHLNVHQSSLLTHRLNQRVKTHRNLEVVLAPSLLALQPVSLQIDRRKFRLAAQNAYFVDEGAFTGEVSFAMLREIVKYAIIGHSERRLHFGETLDMVQNKVAASVRNEITPILCLGETKHEREAGETNLVVHDQLTTAISNLTSDEIENLVVAYEPVWAISSGSNFANHEVAKPSDVQKIAAHIRSIIGQLYGPSAAEKIRVIYGGSSSAENAASYLQVEGIDGLLPGGASLNYVEFSDIIAIAEKAQHQASKQEAA